MFEFIKKNQSICFVVLLFVLVLVMYGSSLAGDFVFDDRNIATYQSFLENPLNWHQVLLTPYWTAESGLYRPVTLFTYGLNYFIFGNGAWSFHLVNLLLYFLSGYFLWLFLKKLFPQKKWLGYLSSILFILLPIHTEVVANIVGRAEILALVFSLLALLELLKKTSNKWLVFLWFLLALGSKETAVAVLPIAFLIMWYRQGSGKKLFDKLCLEKFWFPSVLAPFVYFSIRLLVLGVHFFTNTATLVENPLKFVSFSERIFTALKILYLYISKTFLPFKLCSDYSYNQIEIVKTLWNGEVLVGLFILMISIWGIIYFFKRKFEISLALAFFLFPFLVVSNLITPIGTIMGERLFYFPSVGVVILTGSLIVFIFQRLKKKQMQIAGAIVLVLIGSFYVVKSFERSLDWLSEERLFISAGQCASRSVLSLSNLATVYYFRGDYDRAEEIILDSYKIYDGYTKANNNLGLVYWRKGELEKAKEQYFKAFLHYPPYKGVYENLVLLYLSQGNEKEAQKWMKIGEFY